MGNVLKYEIKKSRFMMLIVGIIIGGLELAYLIGFLVLKQHKMKKFKISSAVSGFSLLFCS